MVRLRIHTFAHSITLTQDMPFLLLLSNRPMDAIRGNLKRDHPPPSALRSVSQVSQCCKHSRKEQESPHRFRLVEGQDQTRMVKVILGTDQRKTPGLTNANCSLPAGMAWAWDMSGQVSWLGGRAKSPRT